MVTNPELRYVIEEILNKRGLTDEEKDMAITRLQKTAKKGVFISLRPKTVIDAFDWVKGVGGANYWNRIYDTY